jgi:hypothetical protein
MSTPSALPDPRFIRTRRVIFGIALASFLLSFFHRTAPAAIASELARVRDQSPCHRHRWRSSPWRILLQSGHRRTR